MNENITPAIRRGRIQELTIYEISEEELTALERSSPVSLYLNFSIFLLSVAISFGATLVTVQFPSDRIYTAFFLIFIVSLVIGFFLMILWLCQYKSGKDIAENIRSRLIPEGEPLPFPSNFQPLSSKD